MSDTRRTPPAGGHESGSLRHALDESEARYRALFEQSPIGVFTFDRDLTITDCNLAFVRLLDSSYERLLGLPLRTLDDPRIVPAFERVLDGEPLYFEGPYVAKLSKATVEMATWITPLRSGEGEVTGGLGLVEDVTARRAAQDALARSEANFRALIENAPDAIGVFRRGGEHLYVNPRLAQYLGYSAEELSEKRVGELVHVDDRTLFRERNDRRDRGEMLPAQEYRLVRKDGQVVFTEIISMQVEFDGGPAVLCMMRDVSERRQMQLKLLQSDRLASLGMLAAGIAHEINNPLAYVMTSLEVLGDQLVPELARLAASDSARERAARAAAMVAQARDGAERMRRIVRDVKTFARGDDDVREPVDVCAVLDAALQLVNHDLRQRARLVRDFAPAPLVSANESRLGQVFLNLLVNALQALPPARADSHEVRVRVSAREGDQEVLIEVIDSGGGIPAALLPRVFDPFFTTKPVGVGTGLGLFVCQGIVASHGGRLAIDSEPGRGTTVRVHLPALPPAGEGAEPSVRAPSVPPPRSASSPPSRRPRLLLIDDEPSLGRALAAALEDDYDIVTVTSGKAALEALSVGEPFDVVLCDLMMPEMDGMALWRKVSASRPALAGRFVFASGGAFTPDATAFLDGGHPYLEKPFDLAELRALLARRATAGLRS